MADDKTKLDIVDAVVADGKWNRKTLIIGSIVGLVVCIIAAAVAIGLWINMSELIVKEKYSLASNLNQQTSTYTDSRIIVTNTRAADNTLTTFIQDYNTFIDVMKMQIDSKEKCFITALNDSLIFNPNGFQLNNRPMDMNNFTNKIYQTSGGKLTDISFLNKQARALCSGVDTYWVIEKTAPVPDSSLIVRSKRQWCGNGCGCGGGCGGYGYGCGGGCGSSSCYCYSPWNCYCRSVSCCW